MGLDKLDHPVNKLDHPAGGPSRVAGIAGRVRWLRRLPVRIMPPGLTLCRCERPHAERRLTDWCSTGSGHTHAGWPLRGFPRLTLLDPDPRPERGAPPVTDQPSLPLSVLDFVGIEYGEPASAAIAGAVDVAQAVEGAGYRRYWVSEHHNMHSLACSAPELLTAHIGARTERIRVGAAGIMLPNHAPFKVAEMFRTLLAMYPGRIDLALGRAPGTDPLTAHVLRRGVAADVQRDFPGQVAELLAFLGDGVPRGPSLHPARGRTRRRRASRDLHARLEPLRPRLRCRQRDERGLRAPPEPRPRVRGAPRLPPRLPAAAPRRPALLRDVRAELRQRRRGGRASSSRPAGR